MYKITEKQFLEGYGDWCSKINWYTAQVLQAQLKKTKNIEVKKALFIKIFMEYVQASEHFIALLHTVKKSHSLVGFRKQLVNCPSGRSSYRYLWEDLKKFESEPRKIYPYLGIDISDSEYSSDKKALDGFYLVAIGCLKIRYKHSRKDRTSKLMKAFGKMKHGFPLYSPEGEKAIFIYMGSKTKTKRIQTNLDEEFISKLVLTLESIHNGALNLSGIVASKGINKS